MGSSGRQGPPLPFGVHHNTAVWGLGAQHLNAVFSAYKWPLFSGHFICYSPVAGPGVLPGVKERVSFTLLIGSACVVKLIEFCNFSGNVAPGFGFLSISNKKNLHQGILDLQLFILFPKPHLQQVVEIDN